MTYGKQHELIINSIAYPVAQSERGTEWELVENGGVLEKVWNNWTDGVGQTVAAPGKNGIYFARAGADTTSPNRLRRAPSMPATASRAGNPSRGWFLEVTDGGGTKYVYLVAGDKAYKYSFDGATLHETLTFAGTAGRPAYYNGAWYVPFGDGNPAKKLTVPVNTPPTSDAAKWASVTGAWQAISLAPFQQAGTTKLARAYSTNKISISADTGDVSNWTDSATIGDTSYAIKDILETQGLLYVAKTNNLYEFDADSVARPLLPPQYQTASLLTSGEALYSLGDIVFYPTVSGLWRYKIGYGIKTVGLDDVEAFTTGAGTFTQAIPIQLFYNGIVSDGKWLYMTCLNNGMTEGLLLAGRFREDHEPPGLEIVWHILGKHTLPLRGLFIDSEHKLWLNTITIVGSIVGTVMSLSVDGSIEGTARDTITSSTVYLPEEDFGLPFVAKSLIDYTFDIAQSGTVNLSLRHITDGGAEAAYTGTITTAGRQTITIPQPNYFYKTRLALVVGTHTADIYSIRARVARPSVFRALIPLDNDVLNGYGLDPEKAWSDLSRLLDSGPHTIQEPGKFYYTAEVVTDDAKWSGYVTGVRHTTYTTDSGSTARAVELTIERYITKVATT